MRSWHWDQSARFQRRGRRFESLEERLPLTAGPTVVDFEVGSSQWTSQFTDFLVASSLGTEGYRVPTGSAAQLNSLPWSNIDTFIVRFSEDVNVRASHLSLTGVNATSFQIQQFAYDAETYTASWTLSAPLEKNSYLLEIDGDGVSPVVNLQGMAIDGDWTTSSSVYPSGNGVAGGDFSFAFRVLPGDVNQNSDVDFYDYSTAVTKIGLTTGSSGYSALIDLDGSGSHTSADASGISSRMWTSYPSGSPIGSSNDAPSTSSGGYLRISVGASVAISLWDDFADAETSDSQLSYQIISTTNSSLWSSQSINATNGELQLTAAMNMDGRSTLVVRATDASGQFVDSRYVIDVGSGISLPELSYTINPTDEGMWCVAGYVWDEGLLEGLLVEFTGAINRYARVQADGSFEILLTAIEDDWGDVTGLVHDWGGAASDDVYQYLGLY